MNALQIKPVDNLITFSKQITLHIVNTIKANTTFRQRLITHLNCFFLLLLLTSLKYYNFLLEYFESFKSTYDHSTIFLYVRTIKINHYISGWSRKYLT